MTTIETLCKILSNGIRGLPYTLPNDTDYEQLLKLSNLQGCTALVNYYIANQIPDDDPVKKRFASTNYATLQKGLLQEVELEKICDAFEKAGIEIVTYKGSIVRELYPYAYLRLMGDIDFLYHQDDEKKVYELMHTLGYKNDMVYGFHRSFIKKPFIEVEFHGALHENKIEFALYNDCFSETINYKEYKHIKTFNQTFHLMFLFTHIYQHLSENGAGIRNYLDLYLFLKEYQKVIDFSKIQHLFEKVGLLTFYRQTMSFMQKFFNIEYGFSEMTDDLYDRYIALIFQGGIYGSSDIRVQEENAFSNSNQNRLKYVMRRIFPPYKILKNSFPVLNRRGMIVLSPFFYLWRIIKVIFKPKKLGKKIKALSLDKKSLSANAEFRKEIGLIIDKDK